MLAMADKDEAEAQSVATASVQELRAKVADIDGGASRLTDLYSTGHRPHRILGQEARSYVRPEDNGGADNPS